MLLHKKVGLLANYKISKGFKLLDKGNGKNIPQRPLQPGYGKEWERIMIQGTGDRLKVKMTK